MYLSIGENNEMRFLIYPHNPEKIRNESSSNTRNIKIQFKECLSENKINFIHNWIFEKKYYICYLVDENGKRVLQMEDCWFEYNPPSSGILHVNWLER